MKCDDHPTIQEDTPVALVVVVVVGHESQKSACTHRMLAGAATSGREVVDSYFIRTHLQQNSIYTSERWGY